MKKLELLHPAHTQHHRGKSPTRVPSTAKQTSTDRDKEIEDLRNQIKLLKQNQKEHDTQEQPKHTENKEEHLEPKKHPGGLRLRRPYSNQHRSVKGTEFRSRNNANTSKLQRPITNVLSYKSDPSGNVVNLSKHSFSFDTYKLLNKNLNFIPTSKRYNKNQLSSDLQNFFS